MRETPLSALVWLLLLCVARSLRLSSERPLACSMVRDSQSCASGNCSALDRVVVIGDVHGEQRGLMEVLFRANLTAHPDSCEWRATSERVLLVQMGDIVDRGAGATEAWACLDVLQRSAVPHSRVVRLLGNHELYWLMGYLQGRNKVADTQSKIRALVVRMREDVLSGRVVAAHMEEVHSVPVLFTHAGVRPLFFAYLRERGVQDAAAIAAYMNEALVASMRACARFPCELSDELYEAGRDRGGRHIGGPFWTDFSVLAQADQSPSPSVHALQVVGHTMAYCYDPSQPDYRPSRDEHECSQGLIRRTPKLSAVCTDAGMYAGARAFFEITNTSQLLAHEMEFDGSWTQRDLLKEVC